MRQRLILLFLPILLIIASSCKTEPEEPAKPTTTIENLKLGHAVAYRRSVYYAAVADEAEVSRLGNLAKMYRAISRSEQIHADGHEAFLQLQGEQTDTSRSPALPLGSVRQALKMSISLESTETTGLYPAMAQAATGEKWPEAAEQFTLFRQADERHAELLTNAQERRGVLSISSYAVCTGCGYIVIDQSEAAECPICKRNAWEKV